MTKEEEKEIEKIAIHKMMSFWSLPFSFIFCFLIYLIHKIKTGETHFEAFLVMMLIMTVMAIYKNYLFEQEKKKREL